MATTTEQLNVVITAQDNASRVFQSIGNQISIAAREVARGALLGVGYQALARVGDAFGAATNAAIGFNSTLEQSRIGWATFLGGVAQANTMLRDLQDFATSTNFTFPEVDVAARRFVAMGIPVANVIPLLRSVAEAAQATGSGADGVNRISLALGQMQSRTLVTAQDMLQLTEVGVPAWQILAQATGKSVAQIQDAVSKGQISADVMITAFQRFADLNWHDLLNVNTFEGAVSNLKDASQQLIAQAFEPLFEAVRNLALNGFALLRSDDMKQFVTNIQNAQVAIGAFFQTITQSESTMKVLQGILLGISAVLGIMFVSAVASATASLLAFFGAMLLANAPLVAFGVAAAALGVVVVANWDDISKATQEMATNIAETLGRLADWVTTSFAPAIGAALKAVWEPVANIGIAALNALAEAWQNFWNQQIGATGQTAFEQLQQQAREGWGGFVDIAAQAIEAVLHDWNALIGFLQGLRTAGVPLVGVLGAIADQTQISTDAIHDFGNQVRAIPGIATQAFQAIQKFVVQDIPAAVQRAVDLVLQAGGDLSQLGDNITQALQQRADEMAKAFGQIGQQGGAALGNALLQTAKPLIEQLTTLLAQVAAGPATAALEDTRATIERDKLLLQVRGVPTEDRAAARRQIRELTRNVLPAQELQAFDVNRNVAIAQRAQTDAERAVQIQNLLTEVQQRQQQGQPVSVPLQVIINNADGTQQTYQELLEANQAAQLPPVVIQSGVRRAG